MTSNKGNLGHGQLGAAMDIISPFIAKDAKAPAILFINGGGFVEVFKLRRCP